MRVRLTDARVAALRPRKREYTVWDERMAGLGVRVRPSGHRSYIYLRGGRKASLGPAALKDIDEVRRECLSLAVEEPAGKVPTFAEFVAGPWKEACWERYKRATRRGIESALNGQLLPAFGTRPLDRIAAVEVNCWFDQYSRTAPGGANEALNVFKRILNRAVASGLIEKNPATGIRRNPRPKLTRFLSREEIRRLHRELDRCAPPTARLSRRRQADIVRLLLATGCRRNEIVRLQWREVDGAVLDLADGKTGPRKVFLNAQARAIVERQPRTESPYVFPSASNPARPANENLPLWYEARKRAGLEDVRLHDLRHTFASHAVMQGVPLPVVARLLGHRNVRMTLRYAHVADKDVEAAAERIGEVLSALLDSAGERDA